MASLIVIDAGPLVALLNKSEREHSRVAKAVQGLRPPFITAEPVLTEACFLLRNEQLAF